MIMLTSIAALTLSFAQPTATPATKATTDTAALAACAPADYGAALACLDKHLTADTKATLKTEGPAMAHFGLGMWMRNNWGLWKGGALKDTFRKAGVLMVDDMSGMILDGYVDQLRGEPTTFEQQLAKRAARRKG